jgi:opacity protein-like surface antigen
MSNVPKRTALGAPFVVLSLAAGAVAQEPATPPPATSEKKDGGGAPHELLPDIGRIGSEAGILGGASWNPYGVGRGFHLGGFFTVPLARVPGGKLSYELHVSFSAATSGPFTITDPIAYIANLAAGASPAAALAGPPGAPFPVRRAVRTELRLLQVSPFGLRYTIRSLDYLRLRPYFGAGLDIVVVISKQRPERSESLQFTGTSPFDDDLIGGLVAQSPELAARGLPSGQGNVELGFHAGGGIEVRVARGLSFNLDYRFTGVGGTRRTHQAASAAFGFHW